MPDDTTARPTALAAEPALRRRGRFLQRQAWEAVVEINRRSCLRGRAQHGFNRETHDAVSARWQSRHEEESSVEETIEFLRWCHYRMPFLFQNSDTFAEMGRQMMSLLFVGLPTARRKTALAAVADYIAGNLEREFMVEMVEGSWAAAEFQPGDRVKSLRGSLTGIVLARYDDGRLVWRPDGTATDLISRPESLLLVRETT
jgi:hypothetical protein